MPHITKGTVFKDTASGGKIKFAGFTDRSKETAIVELVGETDKKGEPKTKHLKFEKLKNSELFKMLKRAEPGEAAPAKAKKTAKAEKPAKTAKAAKVAKAEKPAAKADDDGNCTHCGQPMPGKAVKAAKPKKVKKAVAVGADEEE